MKCPFQRKILGTTFLLVEKGWYGRRAFQSISFDDIIFQRFSDFYFLFFFFLLISSLLLSFLSFLFLKSVSSPRGNERNENRFTLKQDIVFFSHRERGRFQVQNGIFIKGYISPMLFDTRNLFWIECTQNRRRNAGTKFVSQYIYSVYFSFFSFFFFRLLLPFFICNDLHLYLFSNIQSYTLPLYSRTDRYLQQFSQNVT